MGMADFYIKINLKSDIRYKFEEVFQQISSNKMFQILELDDKLQKCSICIECKFDNFLPSLIYIYKKLSIYKDGICSIETHGIDKPFTFSSLEDFILYVFSLNEEKMLDYYKKMGYFSIDAKKYFNKRKKLKKYYQKLAQNDA